MIVRNWIARGSSVFLAALLLSGCSVQMPEKDGAIPVPEKPEFVEELPAEPEVEELPVPEEPEAEPIPEPEPEPEPQPITATLAVCGDVMSHKPLIDDTLDPETGLYDYTRVMAAAMPYVSSADYAVANFETTMAGGPNYTGYPCFNAPDNLAETLKDIGFDLMLTANNHSLDKGFKGLCRTLDVLDEVGLAHVGTSRTQEEQDNNLYVADVGGISVAFLGWTYGTNGISLPKSGPFSVNIFNTDYLTTLSTPDWEAMAAELEKARALETDLIAVMIHWGVEYKNDPNRYQEQMADFLLKQGVDIVLGGHSHVPQPVRMQTVTMEDGSEHAGLVSYSLGNFISAQDYDMTDTTAVFTLELMKDPVTEETSVIGWSYRPMMMLDREEGPERYELLDIYEQLAREDPDAVLKAKLENALATCHRVWGAEYDAVAAERTETPAEIG